MTNSPLAEPLGGPKKATRFALIDHTVRSAEKKPGECEFTSRKQIRQLPRANPGPMLPQNSDVTFCPDAPDSSFLHISSPTDARIRIPGAGFNAFEKHRLHGNWRRPHTQTWSICPDQNRHQRIKSQIPNHKFQEITAKPPQDFRNGSGDLVLGIWDLEFASVCVKPSKCDHERRCPIDR